MILAADERGFSVRKVPLGQRPFTGLFFKFYPRLSAKICVLILFGCGEAGLCISAKIGVLRYIK